MKCMKKQITEAVAAYWTKRLNETESVPVISSIKEFLDICKEKELEVEKKRVSKQGKIVSARIAEKNEKIKSREGEETAKKGSLIVDDGDNTFYAVPEDSISKYYEVDKNGNSATGDNTKWKKIAKNLDYYVTPFDVDIKVNWQKEPLHATKGYSLVCNDKDGKDISPVAPEIFKDKTLWKQIGESAQFSKYSKKQITEAIAYWTKRLNESEDTFSIDNALPVASARDLIWNIIPERKHVSEFDFRTKSFTGVDISSDDIVKITDMCKNNYMYRPFVYYVSASDISVYGNTRLKKFSDAVDAICKEGHGTEDSYNEFINKNFSWYDPNDWSNDYFEEFAAAFPTYADFISAVAETTSNELIDILHDNNDSPLTLVSSDEIKTASDGSAYIIVLWRA